MTEGAGELDRLAAKLGRPAASLSAFRDLTPVQLALLSRAIDEARARRRHDLDAALDRSLPAWVRRAVVALLRARPG